MQSKPATDFELLAAWRAGNSEAGDRLFERHYRPLLRFFSNKVGAEREDLIQATFLGCLEGIDRFRGDSSFRTLLFAIAWNKLRRHNLERGRAFEALDLVEERARGSAPSLGTLLVAKQEQAFLRVAMLRLPVDTQAMLRLYYWEAMPVKEIAVVLERTIGAVKTRMRRGREQLERECKVLRAFAGHDPILACHRIHD